MSDTGVFGLKPVPLPESGAAVAVGMSGGVDSTLAALLLKERGCRVIGITMSKWDGGARWGLGQGTGGCYGPDEIEAIEQCRAFCAENNIEYHVIDVQDEYRTQVLEYVRDEYRCGRTPNPCIRCNPAVKFGALLAAAEKSGIRFDYFCTGHYAGLVCPDVSVADVYRSVRCENTVWDGHIRSGGDGSLRPVMIYNAADISKDQTYFLYRIPQHILSKVRFLFSGMTKREVMEMARSRGLAAANRRESQDFIPLECFSALFSDMPDIQGDFVDMQGRALGKHRGIQYYTVGQRRGLGVSAGYPLYVHSIEKETNRVVLCRNEELLCRSLEAEDWVWAGDYVPNHAFRASVKIRLASQAADALLEPVAEDGQIPLVWKITFEKPQRAVAPGQSAVVYLNKLMLGGGIISRGIYE